MAVRPLILACLGAALLTACTPPAPIAKNSRALVSSVADASNSCDLAVLGAILHFSDGVDAAKVQNARDTCSTAANTIDAMAPPAEADSGQAALFATALHGCGQANASMVEILGIISRGTSPTESDRLRVKNIDIDGRKATCVTDFEKAMVAVNDPISGTVRARLASSKVLGSIAAFAEA